MARSSAAESAYDPCVSTDSREEIRAARAAMNEALARRDLDAIAALLLPTYHVVTARSMQRDGRDASIRSWQALFERDKTAMHELAASEIHVNEGWGMAAEHGTWSGMIGARGGPIAVQGVYAAKWQKTEDGWMLQAEIFTPITIDNGGAQ